ncbi:MAG: TetR/AcrR family transcriptional regulator [Candidatus Solibacter usitatus]|nr:TetR/AcrR family transcriptional regulator [Candidatus Solibacter usitatus]
MTALAPISTKDRILDAAELLFANDGFEATSLRAITAEAGVNLASVNYHFQSKDALLHAVVARRAGPINQRRIEALQQLEEKLRNEPIPIDELLEAFFRPVTECNVLVPRMMVRFHYLEARETFRAIYETHFKPVANRFAPALRKALPHLKPEEAFLRMQFTMGAFAQLAAGSGTMEVVSEGRMHAPTREEALRQLIQFTAAGFRAPSLGAGL